MSKEVSGRKDVDLDKLTNEELLAARDRIQNEISAITQEIARRLIRKQSK